MTTNTFRVISPTGIVRATGRTREDADYLARACGGRVETDPPEEAPVVPRTSHGPRYPEADCDRTSAP